VTPLALPDLPRWIEAHGIAAEVIDLRSLKPLDEDTVLKSLRKTGRLVVVHEASGLCGIAAELAALVVTKAFSALRAPVVRLTGPDAPAASSWVLEQAALPQPEAVAEAVRDLLAGEIRTYNSWRDWEGRGRLTDAPTDLCDPMQGRKMPACSDRYRAAKDRRQSRDAEAAPHERSWRLPTSSLVLSKAPTRGGQ